MLPLAAGTSRHPSPDGDQLLQHGFAAFLMSSPLCLSRGNQGRRLLLCVCNWLPPWQRMRHGLISYLSEPRWVFSVAWCWTEKHLCTSVSQKSQSKRVRCGAGSHSTDVDLASMPLRAPGDEVCLTSGYGVDAEWGHSCFGTWHWRNSWPRASLLLGSCLPCGMHWRALLPHHQAQRPWGKAGNPSFPSSSPELV